METNIYFQNLDFTKIKISTFYKTFYLSQNLIDTTISYKKTLIKDNHYLFTINHKPLLYKKNKDSVIEIETPLAAIFEMFLTGLLEKDLQLLLLEKYNLTNNSFNNLISTAEKLFLKTN
ncbi:MAG: hypothetical protein ABF289_15870 [Clostridiales bacterium]